MVHLISGEEGTFYYDAFFLDSLTFVGGYDSPGSAQEVFKYYDYLFVADSSAGILIVDFIDPSNQTLVNSYETPGSAMDIWIENRISVYRRRPIRPAYRLHQRFYHPCFRGGIRHPGVRVDREILERSYICGR